MKLVHFPLAPVSAPQLPGVPYQIFHQDPVQGTKFIHNLFIQQSFPEHLLCTSPLLCELRTYAVNKTDMAPGFKKLTL